MQGCLSLEDNGDAGKRAGRWEVNGEHTEATGLPTHPSPNYCLQCPVALRCHKAPQWPVSDRFPSNAKCLPSHLPKDADVVCVCVGHTQTHTS